MIYHVMDGVALGRHWSHVIAREQRAERKWCLALQLQGPLPVTHFFQVDSVS